MSQTTDPDKNQQQNESNSENNIENNSPDNKNCGDENDVYKRYNAYRPPENLLKKHPCKDCFNCLWCGDARCELCLRSKGCGNCKKSPEKPDPAA